MPLGWPTNPKARRLIGAFMLAVGLALCGYGVDLGYDNAAFAARASRAAAQVVEIKGRRGARGQKLYYAVAAFADPGTGKTVTFTSRAGLWPSPFAVGDAVTVLYEPGDPPAAEIESFWTLWFMPILIVGFGTVLIVVGGFALAGRI